MLEGLVSSLLNRFLGMYIKDFNPKDLNIGIWGGDVKLRNVEVRREALDWLKLPINVVEGHLGLLTLKIPWASLRTSPVQVFIEDVFLLAAPKEDAEWDQEEEEQRTQALKIEKLDSAEMLKDRNTEGMSQEEQQKSQSFTDSFVTKIVDNLQIAVRNIHVRYEDSISHPAHPFAIGMTLQEFSAKSADGQWKTSFIQDSTGITRKLVKLEALAVYLDSDTKLLGTGREAEVEGYEPLSHDEMIESFKIMIARAEDPTANDHQFILKPVSGEAKFEMNKSAKAGQPHNKLGLTFDEIGLVLDNDQYHDALLLMALMSYFKLHLEYKKLQPKGVTPKEDPRAWFRFAGNAVLSKIHDKSRRWSWDFFKERRDDRIRYIELFKKKTKQETPLTPDEVSALNKLEWKLNYESLRFWRSLARNQLKKENFKPEKPDSAKKNQGWIAWAWGTKPAEEEADPETTMTEEQRKELYDAIDWSEKQALADSVDLPKDTIKFQVDASLKTGSLALKRDPHSHMVEVFSLHFDDFRAKLIHRPDSNLADVSLGDLRVNDGTTPESLYPQIVRVKGAPVAPRVEELEDEAFTHTPSDPFFQLQLELNPLDGSSDVAITGKLKPLEIIYNPRFVAGITKVFHTEDSQMESIGTILESAGATVESLRQQSRAGLEFALENHKTVNVNLDMQAPLIIVPESISVRKSTCLILDAGHIGVKSQLVDKDTIKQVQEKQRQSYSDEDWKRLESLMYDKFIVKLSSTQLLIGPSIEETKVQLEKRDDSRAMRIVDRINIDFMVERSIVPQASDFPRLRISGHLPLLHVSASDKKYKSLMRLVAVVVGNDDTLKEQASVAVDAAPAIDRSSSALSKKPSHVRDRAASQSFQFATQEAIILQDDSSDDDEAEFQDAPDGDEDDNLKLQQKDIEFNFEVDRLQGSLFRSDPEGRKEDQLLVELIAENFSLGFSLRPFDMTVETSLKSVTIDDYVDNPPAEFKSIVSSGDVDADLGDRSNLIQVKFVRVKRESPEFMPKYEGVEMNIGVSISTINLIVTRKTLLTLLDFIMDTFTGGDATVKESSKEIMDIENDEEVVPAAPTKRTDSSSIKVKVDLKSINLILNNDGIRLATLSLNAADIGVFLPDGSTLRVHAKLGKLTLHDDINQGASLDSSVRELITIQGDDLVDFRYETFDAKSPAFPGYDNSVFLRAGSIQVNFLEEPFRKIYAFVVKFGKMQALFTAARQAAVNQASQLQQSAGRMKYDVIIKTPIIVYPRALVPGRQKSDLLTAYLGEIYAENKFVPLDDAHNSITATKISAGIRNVRLTSDFHFGGNKSQELEMIDKVDVGFQISYAEHLDGVKRPEMEIAGSMTDFKFRLTQTQLKFMTEVPAAISKVFTPDVVGTEQEVVEQMPKETAKKTKLAKSKDESALSQTATDRDKTLVDLGPELGVESHIWTKLDLVFDVHTIGLELILVPEDEPVGDVDAASLSKFSLDDTKIKLRAMTDDSSEAELCIRSFTIQDSRTKTSNKFGKVMTSLNKDVQQFMASITISGGQERNLIAMVAIDSPRIIFAMDYIFAIRTFMEQGMASDEPAMPEDEESVLDSREGSDTDSVRTNALIRPSPPRSHTSQSPLKSSSNASSREAESSTTMAFRVNIVDAQIILIANPAHANSEAIVLGTKQILVAKQHATTLQVSKMGMFLCRMDKFQTSRLRILDDFSIQTSLDTSNPTATTIHIDLEPLVLRLSLRDIMLALSIMQKASEMSGSDDEDKNKPSSSDLKAKQLKSSGSGNSSLKRRTASGKATSTVARKPKAPTIPPPPSSGTSNTDAPVVRHDDLSFTLNGVRIILIGDVHELPIMDLSVKGFTATASDYSARYKVDAEIDLYVNVYNFSKSAWEPLIEPWVLGLHVAKETNPDCDSIELSSPRAMELTVTSATIALASKAVQFMSQDEDFLSKPRGAEAPYRIRNYTGFDINVWADDASGKNHMAAKLVDGEEGPWRFEDWEKMRENLSSDNSTGVLGVRLEGSGFDSINKIPVNKEGMYPYSLRPRKDQVLHRLLVDITLGPDNVKVITFRSPLLVMNNTQIPVELGIFDAQEGHLLKIEKIAPGDSRPAPVGAAFLKSLLVRPDQGFGYAWSTESLWWRDLLQRPSRTMTCKGEQDKNAPAFYFQTHAEIDKTDPLSSIYPFMTIRLSAPVELENLLPYDFKYRIYDKNTKKDWTNFVRKGGLSPVHVVELSHLLLLSIDMQDTPFKASEFAIINSNNQEDYRQEHKLVCKDDEGLALNLCLLYHKVPNGGGAFKVTIYSPYVILNMTGLDINIKAKSLLQQAKTAAGQGFHTGSIDTERRKAVPYMFAYGAEDQRNRAILKVGDSSWSKPQSFDAIGNVSDIILPSTSKNTEIHVGISVEQGEGKYKFTRVVTLTPRFVLKNQMTEQINVREPGSSELMTLKPKELKALHFLQKSPQKQLSLCFPGLNNQWSSPFVISDIGTTHIKLAKAGQRQKLIRVEILMENATIFLHLSEEKKNWPFSMRNESDTEFTFFQANPNLDDPDAEDRSGWRPIRYRLPPRSIMPYAWDYPAAKHKEVIINANGKERHIKLSEIGNLIPMKIPAPHAAPGARESKIIDLNVAADGPTQTLILSNYKASKSLYKQKTRSESTTSVAGGFEVKSQDTDVTFKAAIKLAGIGISLIDTRMNELVYVTFRDIMLQWAESPLYQTVTASVKWVQVDNQIYGGMFPMIFYPSVVPKNTKETESHPSVYAQIMRVKDDSYGVTYIKYATLLLQQFTLEIDQDFISSILDFTNIPGASWTEKKYIVPWDDTLDIPEPKQDHSDNDVYFELLNIQPMQLDLSYVYRDKGSVEDKISSKNPFAFFLNVLMMAVGNINDAPVRLNALMLENVRVSWEVLQSNITTHYGQEALSQLHKILGSADFLGNPVGLFNNISSGVVDIFYEPYQGFIMSDSPEQLGIGIAKGATSFVKKSVFGVSDSVSKFTGSIAKGLSEATLDKQFQDRRRMTQSRNRPKHALYGVQAGANSFVTSLASGVGGLARKPFEGAEKEGVAGFFKGIGKGAIGFVTKPAIGVFDLASNVSEGIRNTTTVFDGDGLDRVRLTRFIGTDGIVRPYSQREALGQFWLKQLDNGKYWNEKYIAHLELPREDVVVMLTYSRIMMIKAKNLTSEWDVPMKEIQTISKERTGLSLTLKGGINGPFIPVAEESSRNFLYKNIGVAVQEFNMKYKARE